MTTLCEGSTSNRRRKKMALENACSGKFLVLIYFGNLEIVNPFNIISRFHIVQHSLYLFYELIYCSKYSIKFIIKLSKSLSLNSKFLILKFTISRFFMTKFLVVHTSLSLSLLTYPKEKGESLPIKSDSKIFWFES